MAAKTEKEGHFLDTLAAIRERIARFDRSTTYRKLAELILLESEQRYRALFEAANDAILLIEGERILDCNPKALAMFGCTREQVIREYPGRFLPENQPDGKPSRQMARRKTELALKGEPQFFEWQYYRYDETPFDAEVSLNRVELSGKTFLQAIVRDVTERKKAEEALGRERHKFQTLLEQAPFGMILVDGKGEYTYMNPRFQELFGYTLEDTPNGRMWLKKAFPDPSRRSAVIASWKEDTGKRRRHGNLTRTFTVTSKDGQEKITGFKVVRLEEGGYLVSCEDMTDVKRLEAELLKAQKLESIGILAGGIAHDFNNILAVIMGNISLARSALNYEGTASDRLLEAEKACLRAKDLTHQLLTFSGGGQALKKAIDIGTIVREAVHMALADSGLACDIRLDEGLAAISADEREIRQVLVNILTNAREAMPSGGMVAISVENATASPKDELPFVQRPYVRITIWDRGSGIEKNDLPKIFDPYYTTKPLGVQKGMGLGLAICYSIVKKHDGFIDVESTVGSGTKVCVYLPVLAQGDNHPVLK